MPELKLDSALPVAVARTPLPVGARLCWHLKATFPAPIGTAWLRLSESGRASDPKTILEVISSQGKLWQRFSFDPMPDSRPPLRTEARYLDPARQRGAVLYLKMRAYHFVYTFPDGFAGMVSPLQFIAKDTPRFVTDKRRYTAIRNDKEFYQWNGVAFSQEVAEPGIQNTAMPQTFPASPTREETRFDVAAFDHVYFLRWVSANSRTVLEVWEKSGRKVAAIPIPAPFGAPSKDDFLLARWLDVRRKREPVIILRGWDSVAVYVFGDGMRRILSAQNFNDSSTSIGATTVNFERDAKGILVVSEDYSEPGGPDGSPGESHSTVYYWSGKKFEAQ